MSVTKILCIDYKLVYFQTQANILTLIRPSHSPHVLLLKYFPTTGIANVYDFNHGKKSLNTKRIPAICVKNPIIENLNTTIIKNPPK